MLRVRRIGELFCLLLALTLPAMAQLDKGRITGTVKDSSGAIVPNTAITISNEATGETRTVGSNGVGLFVANALPAGKYGVTAKAEGFAAVQLEHVGLVVGQERVLDVVLNPATVETQVTVDGGQMAQVDTSSARIGVNVTEREVGAVPLNGRQL